MDSMADTIVRDAVTATQESVATRPKTVDQFIDGVTHGAQERVLAFQEHTGVQLHGVMGEVLQAVQGYAAAKRQLFDPQFRVGDTAAQGAAAWNDKGAGNSITVDDGAMSYDEGEDGYWKRTAAHERVHQQQQSGRYNSATLTYVAGGDVKQVEVVGGLTEGQATQVNRTADLTTEYRRHQQTWRSVSRVVGEARLATALKTGDILSLQRDLLGGRP